jgi:aryl-alcohol dehydrogenase-like predicted oxidoreductase
MQYGHIDGLNLPVSKLVLGTLVCTTDDLDNTFALLDAWVEAGGNCIDTAYIYAGGKSERAIGEWLTQRGNRDKILLLDKGGHPIGNSGPRINPHAITADMSESLERLQTDYADIYLLHRDDPNVPIGTLVECMNEHWRDGRVRIFGGSNWTTARLDAANEYAARYGLRGFSASSEQMCLAEVKEPMWGGCLTVDETDRQWHIDRQFPLFPWSSQANGFFTGRFTPDNAENADMVRVYYNDRNWERLRRAQELGDSKGCSANNIALAWVMHQPFPIFPVIGPRNVEELRSSLRAVDITLSEDEMAYLDLT